MKKIKIYLASPYSKGDVGANVHNHYRVADYLSNQGFHVKTPLSSHLWHLIIPRPYEFWMEYDFVELEECDAVVRVDGESSGADREVLYATDLGLPIHHFKGFDFDSLNKLDNFIHNIRAKDDK